VINSKRGTGTRRLGDRETRYVIRGTRRLRVVSGERLVSNGKQFNDSTLHNTHYTLHITHLNNSTINYKLDELDELYKLDELDELYKLYKLYKLIILFF